MGEGVLSHLEYHGLAITIAILIVRQIVEGRNGGSMQKYLYVVSQYILILINTISELYQRLSQLKYELDAIRT